MPQTQSIPSNATCSLFLGSHGSPLLQPLHLTTSDYRTHSSSTSPSNPVMKDYYSPNLEYLASPESPFNLSYPDRRKWTDAFCTADDDHVTKTDDSLTTYSHDGFRSHDDEEDYSMSNSCTGKRRGPKPIADTDVAENSNDPQVKRKAQNRAAQRAFRERKMRYVKELESRIKGIHDAHARETARLVEENMRLRSTAYHLEAENALLKGRPTHLQPNWYPLTDAMPENLSHTHPVSLPNHPPAQYAFAVNPPPLVKTHTSRIKHHSQPGPEAHNAHVHALARSTKEKEHQFCEMLEQQLCDDVIERILSEPLFDKDGKLFDIPVTVSNKTFDNTSYLTARQVWQRLREHPQYGSLSVQQLCQAVKTHAQCAENGPIVFEADLHHIFRELDTNPATPTPHA